MHWLLDACAGCTIAIALAKSRKRRCFLNTAHGVYQDGQIKLDGPVDWPEGLPVEVSPALSKSASEESWGISDDWPDTPEHRAEIIRRIDAIEPLEMTPEEEVEWRAMLKWFDDHSREAVKREMGINP